MKGTLEFVGNFSTYRGWLIVVTKPDPKQRNYRYTAYRQSFGSGMTRFAGSTNLGVIQAQNDAADYIDERLDRKKA